MSETILTITGNGTSIVCDLYENERISLSLMFTDISTFNAKGGFSREFRIPASERNMQFFGDVFSPNYSGWVDPRTKIPATLSVDTIPVAIGHIQVKEYILHLGEPREISIVFFSELPDIGRAIADKNLADLTDLPNLNHALEYTVFADSVDGTLEGGNVIYALVDRGYKLSQEGNGRPIYDSTQPLYIGEFTPCVNALYIWQQIIADAGFYYTGSAVDTELAKWWIPWVNSKDVKCTTTPDDTFFNVYRATDLTSVSGYGQAITGLTEAYDNGANFATDVFTAPYTGTYTFKTWAHFTRTAGSGTSSVYTDLRNSAGTTVYPASASFPPAIVTNGNTNALFWTVDIFLQAGDTVKMFASMSSGTFTFEGDAGNSENIGTGFACIAASYPLQDATVDMPANAPVMKQIEFLKSVVTMMNLAVIADKDAPNNLLFEPLDDYIGSGDTLDWTGKLDIEKDIRIYPTNDFQKRNIKFTYKEDGDAMNAFYRDNAGRVYGQLEIRDTGNDFATGDQVTQIEFRPTPCNIIGGTNVIIPKFVNQQGDFFAVGPRVLYKSGTTDGVYVYDFDTATATATEVILLNHYEEYPVTALVDDLNFGQEVPLHPIDSVPYNTLYNRYHRRYLREIYGGLGSDDLFDQALIMEAHFNLNILDIAKLSFADQIWIKDSYWRVLEVNDHMIGQDEVTRVKLIKILDVQLECDYVVTAIGTGGQILFEDGDGNSSDGSEECCERFGYIWNSAVSKCYSPTSPGGPVRPNGTNPPGEPISMPGAMVLAPQVINQSMTIGTGGGIYQVTAAGGAVTVTLPKAAALPGVVIEFIRIDGTVANVITIDADGSETINGAANTTLATQYAKTRLMSDGSQWFIL